MAPKVSSAGTFCADVPSWGVNDPQSEPSNLDKSLSSMRALAQRLLALEAAAKSTHDPDSYEATRVCEKLRYSLSRFAGPDGFSSLMRRAVALARADNPALVHVKLHPDECMKDLEQLTANARDDGTDAAVSIISYLLGLLVTFIGEPMMVRLVREAWPDADFGPRHE